MVSFLQKGVIRLKKQLIYVEALEKQLVKYKEKQREQIKKNPL